jgi:uncharacterized protein (DUF433 family)
MNWRERIEADPLKLDGKPVIKGTRIPVGLILGYLASGWDAASTAYLFPALSTEDVVACLHFAAALAHNAREIPNPVDLSEDGELSPLEG